MTVIASGGEVTILDGFKIHTFRNGGTLTVYSAGNVESLVVAGGGGGGSSYIPYGISRGGGGGAGGVIHTATLPVAIGDITVTVGSGGGPLENGGNSVITDGNISFSTQTAIGGGRGGGNGNAAIGGSGGGGTGDAGAFYGAAGTAGQGNDGADGGSYGGGGGGGAGADASQDDGGVGAAYTTSGISTYYAGGGGGGPSGVGGQGGGGGGSSVSGQANTGGGGGGGGNSDGALGGSGGSGIVIFRYAYPLPAVRRVAENEDLANVAESTFKGRKAAAGTGIPQDMTAAEAATVLADYFVEQNVAITPATKTKITYDAQGLVTAGADAGITDITGLEAALNNRPTYSWVDNNLPTFYYDFKFNNTAADIGGIYYKMLPLSTGEAESTWDSSPLDVSANPQALINFASDALGINTLKKGVYSAHIHATLAATPDPYTVSYLFELYTRTSGGTETLRATSSYNTTGATDSTIIYAVAELDDDVDILATDRIIIKWFALVSSAPGGSYTTITLHMEGTTDSRFTIPTTSEMISSSGSGVLTGVTADAPLSGAGTPASHLVLGVVPASLGGTGVANGAAASLTLPNLAIEIAGGGAGQIYTLPATSQTLAGLAVSGQTFTTAQTISAGYTTEAFKIIVSGAGTPTKFIFDTTNVRFGINTPTPASAIQIVSGTTQLLGLYLTTTNTTASFNISATGDALYVNNSAGDYYFNAQAAKTMYFQTANTARLIIGPTGLVQIGAGTATARFNVLGFTDIVQANVTGHTTQAVATSLVQFTRNDTAAGVSAMLGLTALGSGAAGDGGSILFAGKSSTTAATAMGLIDWRYIVATHASYTTAVRIYARDAAGARLGLEIEGSGAAAKIALYGVATTLRATTAIAAGTFVANTSGVVDDSATFAGYTLGQVVQALQNIGILT